MTFLNWWSDVALFLGAWAVYESLKARQWGWAVGGAGLVIAILLGGVLLSEAGPGGAVPGMAVGVQQMLQTLRDGRNWSVGLGEFVWLP